LDLSYSMFVICCGENWLNVVWAWNKTACMQLDIGNFRIAM